MKVVKAFTRESRRSRFHRKSKQYYDRTMRIAYTFAGKVADDRGGGDFHRRRSCPVRRVLGAGSPDASVRHQDQQRTADSRLMSLFFGMLAGASDPVRRLTTVFNSLQHGAAASDHLYELLDRESAVVDPAVPERLPAMLGRIEFRDVSFTVRRERTGVATRESANRTRRNDRDRRRQWLQQSTLMNLLPRFYDPNSG